MPTLLHQRRTALDVDHAPLWRCDWFGVDGAVCLVVRGELDLLTAPALHRSLRLAQEAADLVVLDLRQLDFIDCSGIRTILMADRRAHARGERLAVVRGPVEVELFLKVTGSDHGLWLIDRPSAAFEGSQIEWSFATGSRDPAGVAALEHHIGQAQASGRTPIVVDLSRSLDADTRTVSLLCAALRRVARSGPPLLIVGAPPHVERVLELCAIDGLVLFPTLVKPSPSDRAPAPGAARRIPLPLATSRPPDLRIVGPSTP